MSDKIEFKTTDSFEDTFNKLNILVKILQDENKNIKPPLGLMPKDIHKRNRFHDVCSAISRHYNSGSKIPIKWIQEYNELLGGD